LLAKNRFAANLLLTLLLLPLLCATATSQLPAPVWRPMGPPGGDVFSLASDPSDGKRIYLGTADGHIFGSGDGGNNWSLLGRAGGADGVVMALLVDPREPRRLFAAVWTRNASGGGVYRSEDAGRTWNAAGLEGRAVRALARAASRPDVLVAGALDGIFRTSDGGKSWERISPEGHEELRNIDSLAVDPAAHDIIYAGTFHLPWKTTDGGKKWTAIHAGMIDDSDVMSIIVDRTNPRRLYASACSGIYRSDNSGGVWRKVQGIPYSARRTHVIRQDPLRPGIIYAGTTEGLWRTTDAGANWRRLTPREWVVNALELDPAAPGRIVLGTERLGVMASDDAGRTFRSSNSGFHHRQILALALDRARPGRVLAVLSNSPEPVLATDDAGRNWKPLGPGLKTEKLQRLLALDDVWLAVPERGLIRYEQARSAWTRAGALVGQAAAARDKKGNLIPPRGPTPFDLPVHDLAASAQGWFAATPRGLLVSRDRGSTWELFRVGPVVLPVQSVRVSADEQSFWVVTLRGMAFSRDAGATWAWHDLPFEAGGALRLDVADAQTIFAVARNGLYISRDAGKSWTRAASGLPQAPVQDLAIAGENVLVSMQARGLFLSSNLGKTWERVEGTLAEGFFPVVTAPLDSGVIFAASATDGLFSIELPVSRARAGGPETRPATAPK
jgi:photosystem II stability/assembly factor-like uncharacterized protein